MNVNALTLRFQSDAIYEITHKNYADIIFALSLHGWHAKPGIQMTNHIGTQGRCFVRIEPVDVFLIFTFQFCIYETVFHFTLRFIRFTPRWT
jgi:hypothetical protein